MGKLATTVDRLETKLATTEDRLTELEESLGTASEATTMDHATLTQKGWSSSISWVTWVQNATDATDYHSELQRAHPDVFIPPSRCMDSSASTWAIFSGSSGF